MFKLATSLDTSVSILFWNSFCFFVASSAFDENTINAVITAPIAAANARYGLAIIRAYNLCKTLI